MNKTNTTAATATPEKLQFWINNGYNVLFEGHHGVGKTAMILEAFKKANLNYLYFSGSTLDPFLDFCGVPVKTQSPSGQTVIDLILPKHIDAGSVEAIFIDEYNRSHKKVRNATMELIQFRTVNGRPFPKLKVIWVAINPEDDDSDDDAHYDVDPLDPAQKDRFHVQVQIPYRLNVAYLSSVYGCECANAAAEWWGELNDETKWLVSPRRVDYALNMYKDGGDVCDILPISSNPSVLKMRLKDGSIEGRVRQYLESNNTESAKQLAEDASTIDSLLRIIVKQPDYLRFYLPLVPKERIASLFAKKCQIRQYVLRDIQNDPLGSVFAEMVKAVAASGLDKQAANFINNQVMPYIQRAEKKLELEDSNADGSKSFNTDVLPACDSVLEGVSGLTADQSNYIRSSLDNAFLWGTRERISAYKQLEKIVLDGVNKMTDAEMGHILCTFTRMIRDSHANTAAKHFSSMPSLYDLIMRQAIVNGYSYDSIADYLHRCFSKPEKFHKFIAQMGWKVYDEEDFPHLVNTVEVVDGNGCVGYRYRESIGSVEYQYYDHNDPEDEEI